MPEVFQLPPLIIATELVGPHNQVHIQVGKQCAVDHSAKSVYRIYTHDERHIRFAATCVLIDIPAWDQLKLYENERELYL